MGHFIVEGISTRVKSPMKIHGRFYLSKKTPDYKMTHQLFTLFWIISNILTFHFYTFSVIYTFYFYIAFEELTFYQKCSIKCVLYSLFYTLKAFKSTLADELSYKYKGTKWQKYEKDVNEMRSLCFYRKEKGLLHINPKWLPPLQ